MKFIVTRASLWSDEKPCDETYQKEVIRYGKPCIMWVKEIPDLESLLDFSHKEGDLIIITSDKIKRVDGEIEIYDSCRE